jgi:hypothetical protein
MRPQYVFRPTADALEPRRVPSSLAAPHAAVHLHPHAHVHHVAHRDATLTGGLGGGLVGNAAGVNLFPFVAGTLYGVAVAGGTPTGVLTRLPGSTPVSGYASPYPGAYFGSTQTVFGQLGPNDVLLSGIPSSTVAAADYGSVLMGPGGDFNSLVLFGGPEGTPGGTLNNLVLY